MVRATFEMMGADRMILISDSMRATGMPDGQYTLGGLDVKVVGKRATLVSDGGNSWFSNEPRGLYENSCKRNADSV